MTIARCVKDMSIFSFLVFDHLAVGVVRTVFLVQATKSLHSNDNPSSERYLAAFEFPPNVLLCGILNSDDGGYELSPKFIDRTLG